ncbi:acyl-CoA dehydrogenase family protein [Verminephrobacter eiseniae]|uniref:acyl-CoA dehydrogenase family protein n=1 Tax=Verminephrobacter eiseniae TaxID=364317 RepID=UPI0010D1A029|nr:acyl-CoA dehydrogenase family protein [Verminephrobacter eiseniae]KAB7603592.1 pimeloyl-CoA dehydrogenase small subunit [Verminephrobacter sp. Larva24]MCW5232784.1 pimeloyl-CoA dehydrogenase small subunit [Verminephrobacter eiseniae]MCW5295652.1 pimeloyl-CoA dehydrogenase small subunit [Verminephrobacter eiseniae]MCW8184780.1 pimeloyl-CoA dehydrogenase small subunit [Verminephrobacter eiseniae]MCW8221770.1 pimeloyl-CoA dehydrogenase small subunit [Verminephrobacter eiseniae]
MDLRLSEEQQQFADSLRRWIEKDYTFEARLKIIRSDAGVSQPAYAALTELGALALAVPEEAGGMGGRSEDLMIVMKEIGRGLVVEPYFATILAAEFFKQAGAHKPILERVAAGDMKLACALNEKGAGHELFNIGLAARQDGAGYVLNGAKCSVVHGGQADGFVVSVRSGGGQRDRDGITLVHVPRAAQGLTVTDFRTFDGQRGADLAFADVRVPASAVVGQAGQGWDILEAVTDYGVALLCAEAVGAIEQANALTLDYLKTRKQFGVPIGTFQVLQHRMADMYIHQEQARSITVLAAVKVQTAAPDERRKLVSAAKVRVGKALQFVGQQAIQMHGGMGMTNEMSISHYFKRLTAIEMTLGNTDFHRSRFISQPGFAAV